MTERRGKLLEDSRAFHCFDHRVIASGLSRARNVALEACATRYIVYLDDDASPRPEWLSAILRAFTTHDPDVVAGPIIRCGRTLSRNGCPTNTSPASRFSITAQTITGCRGRIRLRCQHGFQGRRAPRGRRIQRRSRTRGAHSLLSEEEVEAQLALRQRGRRTFYAAAAGVDHAVHPNRLTRNYFRARMAWQAVSALLRDPPLLHSDWSQREITAAADKLGLRELIAKLMTSGDAQTFSAQLDFIHLFAILLESKDLDDPSVEGMFAGLE